MEYALVYSTFNCILLVERNKNWKETMIQFDKANFNFHGGYLTYGTEGRFVARFKYDASKRNKFINFLTKNFTVEEYFFLLEDKDVSPLKILLARGYISVTKKRQAQFLESLREQGLYEVNQKREAGDKKQIEDYLTELVK